MYNPTGPSTHTNTSPTANTNTNAPTKNVAMPFRVDIVDISSDTSTDGYQEKRKQKKSTEEKSLKHLLVLILNQTDKDQRKE